MFRCVSRTCLLAASLSVIGGACALPGEDEDLGSSELASSLDDSLRAIATGNGLTPYPHSTRYDFETYEQRHTVRLRADLGRFLFFDHIMSGVEQTSCGTCHSAEFQMSDERNIARGTFCNMNADLTQIFCEEAPAGGEGGNVTGPDRLSPLNQRNTPTVINTALFPKQMWNGRFSFVDDHSTDVNQLDASLGFQFPAPENVLFTRSLLTGQAHIPVTEAIEMTGDFPRFGEPFPVPDIRNPEVRGTLADIVSDIPAYRVLFEEAFAPGSQVTPLDPEIAPGDPIPYLAIADAMAHFEEQDLVMTDSPWDDYLAGDDTAISSQAKQGALLFFGKGKCSTCHSGNMFSDFENHNIGVPQVGPGSGQKDDADPKYQGLHSYDFGLEEITGVRGDRFKFRTAPLRGVALTSPFMHSGQFTTLTDAIKHHLNPRMSYDNYDISQIELAMQEADGLKPPEPVFDMANPVVIGPGTAIKPKLSNAEIAQIIEFLKTLTDPRMLDTAALQPTSLPSGLPPDVPGEHRFPQYF